MLKSLFAGVSGLQAHQVAMDVESNNIANVNTVGFKYSRANFSDLLAQTKSIATAPQGELGGKNPVQIGLGTSASSMTRIFSQGSIQNSDKNTDIAIQGDGFFIVSPDGGKTYNYTRAGDFKFDANGNFVDNNGYIVQGWLRDPNTGKVDSTAPIQNIVIPPGLTTPAKATTAITLKANLNAGNNVVSFSAIRPLDAFEKAVDLNRDGKLNSSDSLQTPQAAYDNIIPGTDSGGNPVYANPDANALTNPDAINENNHNYLFKDSKGVIIDRAEDVGVLVNATGSSFNLQAGTTADTGQGVWVGFRNAQATAPNNVAAGAINIATGSIKINGVNVAAISTPATNTATQNANAIAAAINQISSKTGVVATVLAGPKIQLTNNNLGTTKNITLNIANPATATATGFTVGTTVDAPMKKFRYTDGSNNPVGWDSTESIYYFRTTEDLRQGMQTLLRNPNAAPGDLLAKKNHIGVNGTGPRIEIDNKGKFTVYNPGDDPNINYDLNIAVSAITDAQTTENVRFTQTMQAMSGALPSGSTGFRQTQAFNVPTHSSSIDIYDSLGTKHTVKIDFRKASYNATTGSTWDVMISVAEPAVINVAGGATGIPKNIIEGQVSFNPDGSLSTFNPPSITFTANNGSAPNQSINLVVGTSNKFDGLTSFDSKSTTSGISQDGYTGGDLVGIRIDQSGTLVGSFSNGRSFGLAQVAMAKFANNEGLATEGGNLYRQSANSGDPIIGTAATGGRGFIQASALEASNVDLSRALTQLIIIQRGYQANGKTITTSDQLLQTLIGLKQ